MATVYAEAIDPERPFVSAHPGGFSGYSGCRRALFNVFQNVVDVGTKPEAEIELDAPFVGWSRAEIAERRLEHGVPCEVT